MTQSTFIHVLPPHVANQIAAGEVVERPASAVKELMENALDAGATSIVVRIEEAGKKRIEIEDDGCGMSVADAELALQRHATSKIETSEDLHRIASHGFRGEALPSIASVSRFRMLTCAKGNQEGTEVRVHGGKNTEVRPAPTRQGTKLEVLDLFLNTPARLNFMRTNKTEEAAIIEVFRALALAHPSVSLRLDLDGRKRLDFHAESEAQRVFTMMGKHFSQNSLEQSVEHEGILVSAHLGLPTFHHRDSTRMNFLVNGRVIRDKQLMAALRAAYRDVMFHDRYPVAVIRIEIDPAKVDVNVHPAKREVRFSSPQTVRAAIVACVRAGIERMGQTVASTTTQKALQSLSPSNTPTQATVQRNMPRFSSQSPNNLLQARSFSAHPAKHEKASSELQSLLFRAPESQTPEVQENAANYQASSVQSPLKLGTALAQLHRCYILSQTYEGLILVDQHAAHERIRYEQLKAQLATSSIACQMLLTPLPIDISGEQAAWLSDHDETLNAFGVKLSMQDDESFLLYGVPAMLADESPESLVLELIESCCLLGVNMEAGTSGLGRVLERWLGNRACKGSIKSGRILHHEEQNNLLREMENTHNIAQCNHGRPTYVKLSLHELDRLFGRKE
ncbi:MAG: DNA mismatch repair endonuclease MutL [Zetaproteobacteria bacterium]|nr:DNA mismatch repair endonuclease MutL [Zetaproteobacteria bacterium]